MNSPFSEALTNLATWLLLASSAWWVLLCAAALLEARTSGRLRATTWVGCPPAMRGALLACVGVALAGGAATGAHAAQDPGAPAPGLPVPARPVGHAASSTPGPGAVTVRPGDSLWRIAEAHLAPTRAPRVVADLVERIHRRNHLVIGSDPDLVHPGQRLELPALTRPVPSHLEESP